MAKVDISKLEELLSQGRTPAEAARILGVNRSSVHKKVKRLKLNTVKIVTLEKAAEVVEKKLDTIGQLQKINDYANELLDLLMRWNRGDEVALQILESQVAKKKVKVGDEEMEVQEFKFTDPRQLALRAMGEIREQLRLQVEIFKTLYDVEAVREFQQVVLQAIGEVDPNVREKIIANLNKRRAIRSSVQFG
jgi:hypothetical protein